MRASSPIFLLLSLVLGACVSGSASRPGPGSDTNVITEEELAAFPGTSAYDAVSRLRAQWLRGRSGTFRSETGRNYPQVFVDGRPWGGIESLQQIDISQIGQIHFISAADATTRFGTGYPAGIIEVITKRTPRSAPD